MSPHAGHFLSRDSARLRYRAAGAGPALVLVHGWLLDLACWDLLEPALPPRFRVLSMDRRGYGGSSGAPSLEADALDVLAMLDELGIERAAVVGHSQGARVALEIVRRAPQRVGSVILDGSPALPGLPGGPWLEETPLARYRELLLAEGPAALRQALAEHPLMRLATADEAAHAALATMLARNCVAGLDAPPPARDCAWAAVPPGMPALVVNGELDTPQRLAAGDALAALIPGAERRVLPGAGHLACLDQPAAYGRLVAEFVLRSTSPRTPERMEPT